MALSLLLAAALGASPLPAPVEADVRCIAVFSLYASQNEAEKAGITGAIMYYVGRIDGRSPGLPIASRLSHLVADDAFRRNELPAEAQRCGQEMIEKGDAVQVLGRTVEGAGHKPAGGN